MKKRLKIILTILVVALLLLVAATVLVLSGHWTAKSPTGICLQKPGSGNLCDISLINASTPEEQAKGLGDRDSLPADEGMIFSFPDSAVRCFWMKDMRFSIDILWLDENSQIVAKETNISPGTYPKNFCPDVAARSVIELNANVARDWPVGTKLLVSTNTAD